MLCVFFGYGVRPHVKAHDYRVRRLRQHHVRLIYRPDRSVYYPDADLVVRYFFQRLAHRLDGTHYIRLNYYGKLFHLALLNLREKIVKRDLLIRFKLFFLLLLAALLHQKAREFFVLNGIKDVAGRGHLGKTRDFNRH